MAEVTVTLILRDTDRTAELKIDDLDPVGTVERAARQAFGLEEVGCKIEGTDTMLTEQARLLPQLGDARRIVVWEHVFPEMTGAAAAEAKAVAAGKIGANTDN
eukprot:TRINITY_DN115304_c0_g1_i1.p1 TRINITY_DN115304_c0_g1~~TRINITY_DN115304_c0_g1_i1.p1  ORF type:complete len:119 (-),score=41.00 TRINITY_DN115304_c0_g1_i1:71-379(-)